MLEVENQERIFVAGTTALPQYDLAHGVPVASRLRLLLYDDGFGVAPIEIAVVFGFDTLGRLVDAVLQRRQLDLGFSAVGHSRGSHGPQRPVEITISQAALRSKVWQFLAPTAR